MCAASDPNRPARLGGPTDNLARVRDDRLQRVLHTTTAARFPDLDANARAILVLCILEKWIVNNIC